MVFNVNSDNYNTEDTTIERDSPIPQRSPPGINAKSLKFDQYVKRNENLNPEILLERFSQFKEKPVSIFDQIQNVVADFLFKVLSKYQKIEKIWFSLTNKSAKDYDLESKRFTLDLDILSVICETPPTEDMTQLEALRYMATMLERENANMRNPDMLKRIKNAIKFAEEMHSKPFNDVVHHIQTEIQQLQSQEKMLIPVGYFLLDHNMEALLEISRESNGTYRVTLISSNEELRELFDKEMGCDLKTQAIRREMTNVSEVELLASISTFVDLQTSEACKAGTAWRSVFLQTLHYDQSRVEVSAPVEAFSPGRSTGHFGEAISYVSGDMGSPENSKRFNLALRLRLFLDICQSNKKSLKNPQYWKSVRRAALHLAALIEKDKSILGSKDEMGLELTRIYYAIKSLLDDLDNTTPDLVDLRTKTLPLISDGIEVELPKETPDLVPIRGKPNIYPKVETPLVLAGDDAFVKTIDNWGKRIRALIAKDSIDVAASEARLMVQMLPHCAGMEKLDEDELALVLVTLNHLAEAIARSEMGNFPCSIENVTSMTILNFFAFNFAAHLNKRLKGDPLRFQAMFIPLIIPAKKILNDLNKCHLTKNDRNTLYQLENQILNTFRSDLGLGRNQDLNDLRESSSVSDKLKLSTPPGYQALLNMKMLSQIVVTGEAPINVNHRSPMIFKRALMGDSVSLEGHTFSTGFSKSYRIPLPLVAPSYASDVSKEINSHYTTEYCCLGCIRDNCPNYNTVSLDKQRFHPLYMLHHFIDTYCKNLSNSKQYHRDELADLMYLQQTNQSASQIYNGPHGGQDGFDVALGFNENDHIIQFQNAFIAYLEHPHFFKHPELRWLFENKIFTNQVFTKMILQKNISEFKPFLLSAFTKIAKEARVAGSIADKETAAYLWYLSGELREMIEDSNLVDKNELLARLPKENEAIMFKWAEELIGKNEESELKNQMMVFPLVLQRYFKKFAADCKDPCFESDKDLEIIFGVAATIESNEALRKSIDPQIYARCRSIISLATYKAMERISKETKDTKGDFVNKVLFRSHPAVAALRLKWESANFPTFLATTKDGKCYKFDLSTGKVLFEDRRAENIPRNLKRDPALKRLFGEALNENWNLIGTPEGHQEKVIGYTHSKFPHFRIVAKYNTTASCDPVVSVERRFKKPDGNYVWLTYHEFDTQNSMREQTLFSETPDLPIIFAVTIGSRTCWVDPTLEMIHVMEEGCNELYATMKVEKTLTSGYRVTDLHLVKEDNHLLSTTPKDLEKLCAIEDPKFIAVLGKKNKATTFNFPRYEISTTGTPLTYDIGEEGISCQSFPKFTLANPGVRPGSQDPAIGVRTLPTAYDGYHLLQKGSEEKVLIPLRGFKPDFSISGIPLPGSKTIFSEAFEKCQIYEFSVDKETNRLTAKSGDGYAYLAYLCLAHWDYESAAYYLSKARTTAGYGKNYEQVFEWVGQWKDETPSGLAIKLRFNLFRIKVLQDEQIRNIRAGEKQKANEIAINHTPHLIEIAKAYEKYRDILKIKEREVNELDPAFDLTNLEEQEVQHHIQALLKTHGKQPIETKELKPARGIELPLQSFIMNDRKIAGINTGSLLIWSLCDHSEQKMASTTVNDPEWIVHNFRFLFNQILQADTKTVQYQHLKNQIRMIAEMKGSHLYPKGRMSVELAQSYLLKLMTAKEKGLAEYQQLIALLGTSKALQQIEREYFANSNVERLLTSADILTDLGMQDPEYAKDKARTMLYDNSWFGFIYDFMGTSQRSIGLKILRFVDKWEKTSQGTFQNEFNDFLLNEFCGQKGKTSLQNFDAALNILEPVDILVNEQTMDPIPVVRIPKETFQDRFGPLLSKKTEDYKSRIKELELEIAQNPENKKPELVVSKPVIHTVLNKFCRSLYCRYFFTVTEVEPPKINQSLFESLANSDEKAYARVAKKHQEDLAAHLNTKKIKALITQEKAEELRDDLVRERGTIARQEEELKLKLLQQVEYFDSPAGVIAMRRLVGKGVKPSLDVLIQLWRRGETVKEWSKHPFSKLGMKKMPEAELKQLDQDIASYLELCTAHNHLDRVVQMADDYIASKGNEQLANNLYEAIQTKRSYTSEDSDARDLLYMEYTQKIILYADQTQTMREMTFDPNAVRQLRMGRGKTEVIMPILAKRKATGKNLVLLVLPEELYETNCSGLDIKNRALFGQDIHRFEWSRKTDMSVESLERIHINLLDTIKNKGFMPTTKRSILSMKDSYVLLLNKLSEMQPHEDKSELLGQIRAMSKILALFQNQGEILADEVDACLDVRKEVNFAIGKQEVVDQVKGDVAAELMMLLLYHELPAATDPDRENSILLHELKVALLQTTNAAISPKKRREALKVLTGLYFDKHQPEGFERESFIAYILDDPDAKEVEKQVLALKESNNGLFKQISSVKTFINQGFGTTLAKVGNVNYGRDPITGVNTIPYKASNAPSINSEYDDDIERISFTFQDYLQNGVSYKQIYQIVARMQNKAIGELRASEDEYANILDMPAAQEFQQFLREIDPENKLPASINLASVCDPTVIKTLVNTLNESPKGLLAFCHRQVISNMQQYSAQIDAKSTELPGLVKSFGGFTGTPWNIHTYHDKINAEVNLGVDGTTWALMLGREVDVKTFKFDPEKPIDSLLSSIDVVSNHQAMIDTGAYLRGTSNSEFIDQVLDRSAKGNKGVQAGIYFDDSGTIVKKCAVDDKPLPLQYAQATDLMKTVTIYDQAHTVGADVKQGAKATAVVTIGENTFIRDLFQAVWRLRQLHLDQRVTLALSEEIKARVLEGSTEDSIKLVEEIHAFCLINEIKREAEDNFKAEKEKIQSFGKRLLLETIVNEINNQVSDDTLCEMSRRFAGNSGLLIKKRPKEEAYDNYARLKTIEKPSVVFEQLKSTEEKKCLQIAKLFEEMHLQAAEQQFTRQSAVIAKRENPPEDWFLNKVESNIVDGAEVEQEAQAEMELTLEMLTETQTQTQTEVVCEVSIPIAQNGAAGSGDVFPLELDDLQTLTEKNAFNESFRSIMSCLPFFKQRIYCTAVFERNLPHQNNGNKVSPQSFFYSDRKPVKQVMIVKTKDSWKMVIPTIHEAQGACRAFINKTEDAAVVVALSAGQPLMIGKSGEDRSDALPFTTPADQDRFYQYYIQAKLLNGEIDFTTQEEKYALKKWLLTVGVDDFKSYFEQNILPAKPRRFADRYVKSTLFEVFREVAGEAILTEEEVEQRYPPLGSVVEEKKEPVVIDVRESGVSIEGVPGEGREVNNGSLVTGNMGDGLPQTIDALTAYFEGQARTIETLEEMDKRIEKVLKENSDLIRGGEKGEKAKLMMAVSRALSGAMEKHITKMFERYTHTLESKV